MYKISIIIPVYNVEDEIDNAFKSIYNQTFGFENLEVIFIDDCSTDNSQKYIQSYMDKYSNVKGIFLDENSGFAGKPRNIGMSIASAKYLMFLDPDDIYLSNACEILYKTIIHTGDDFVSANYLFDNNDNITYGWNYLNTKSEIHVETIKQDYNLLKLPPSVWTKIIRKDFITDNNITFPEGIPGQDLIFITESLIKAKGINYINIPVVKYSFRDSDDKNKSITSIKNKKVLAGYLTAYFELYNILNNYNKNISWLAPRNLYFWSKQFIEGNISLNDRIDLLKYSSFLFEEFMESKYLKPKKGYETLFNLVYDKEFDKAARFSVELNNYLNDNLIDVSEVKKRDIYMLFWGFEDQIGGLAKAVFNRSNMLDNKGFNVKLLNIEPFINHYMINHFRDYDSIEKKFRKLNYINDNVEFYNIFSYYSKKNTVDYTKHNINPIIIEIKENITILENYIVQKKNNDDDSVEYVFYDTKYLIEDEYDFILELIVNQEPQEIESFLSKIKKFKVKSEKYINNYLAVENIFVNGDLAYENLYTIDGFNYFTIKHNNSTIDFIIKNREDNFIIKFKSLQEFNDHFVKEMCLSSNKKPFIINDCSSKIPTIKNIDSDIAYKIGNIHSNPYKKPYCYGSQLRPFGALENIEDLDALVTLTSTQKEDLKKEFGLNNIYKIPNLLPIEESSLERKFDDKKISIFSRISPEKNLSDVIYAINIIKKIIPDVQLGIYGRAFGDKEIKEKLKLEALIEALNLQDNITFYGHVDNVSEEMSKSLVTLLTSKFEGMGMVIIESMMNAVPVVSYDLNYGPSDIINNGVDGYLVEQYNIEQLAETILIFLKNPQKSLTMGKNAYNNVKENFSENIIYSKWERLFQKAILYSKIKKYKQYMKEDSTYTRNQITKLKQENKLLNSKYTELRERNTLKNEFIDKLKNQITDLKEENKSLNNEYTNLHERNTLKNEFINKLKKQNSNLKKENKSVKNKYNKLYERNTLKNEFINKLKEENTNLKKENKLVQK